MVNESVQSKELLVRVHFGRSYLERDMCTPYGVCRPGWELFATYKSRKSVQSFMKILESWLLIIFFAVLIFVFEKTDIALFILALLWIGSRDQIHLLKNIIKPKN